MAEARTFFVQHPWDDLTILRLGKYFDVRNADEVKQACIKAVEQGACRYIFDFHETRFVDSAGLAVLATMYRRLQSTCGEPGMVVAARLSDEVRSTLVATRLDELVLLADTMEEAIQLIQPGTS